MTEETWQTIHGSGAAADLSGGVRLCLSGPDAVRYLNGQVTQDVRKLQPGQALPACVTNHKGKLEAWVFLTLAGDGSGSLLISADAGVADFLPARLEKYLIADNCELRDITGETSLLHLTGTLAAAAPALLAAGETAAACSRFGPPGLDLWTTPERLEFWRARSELLLTAGDLSDLEVLYGIPAWEAELTPGLLPPEAGLDATAIDYHKGCYIGQEIISRLRSIGRVNRLLTALRQSGGPPRLEPGWTVCGTGPDGDPAPAGTITRVADHPLTGIRHALAFLHRTASAPFLCGPDRPDAAPDVPVIKTLDV